MAGYIGSIPVPQATQTREAFTATSNQTTFNTGGYTAGFIDVYMNGVKLAAADFTATNGSDVVLASGAAANDIVEVVAYTAFEVLNQNFTGTTTVEALTATGAISGTSADFDGGVTIDNITIDGAEIDLSSGNLLIDVAGDIYLDADGGDVVLFDGGTEFGRFEQNSNNLRIKSSVSDGDILFMGSDNGSAVTALTLDMSDAGSAIFNNNVGIGVTPFAKLNVYGSNNSNVMVVDAQGTAPNYIFDVRDDGTSKFRVDGSGNVGIGTSSPTRAIDISSSSFSGSVLQISRTGTGVNNDGGIIFRGGAGAADDAALGGIYFQNTLDDNSYALIRSRTDDATGTSGRLDFITSTAAINNSTASRMTINSSGKVGIGLSNPEDYYSNAFVVKAANESAGGGITIAASSTSDVNYLMFADGTSGTERYRGYLQYNHANDDFFMIGAGPLRFYSGSAERIRIDSSGQVGIGTTSPKLNANGGQFLTLQGTGANAWLELATTSQSDNLGGAITFNNTNVSGTDKRVAQISSLRNGADNKAHLSFATNNGSGNTERMRILSGGGITFNGDTAAANALDDYETGSWTPRIRDGAGNIIGDSNNVGRYVKVGDLVQASFSVQRNDSGSHTGYLLISGFPFSVNTATNLILVGGGGIWIDNGVGSDYVSSTVYHNGTYLFGVMDHRIDSGNRYIQATQVNNGRYVYGSYIYRSA